MTTTQQEVKVLKKEVAELKDTLSEQAEQKYYNIAAKATDVKDEVSRIAHIAGQNISHFIGNKQEQLIDAKDRTERTIKNRPFTSAAIAFGAGVLLTALIKKK